jgi:hypothetical protein
MLSIEVVRLTEAHASGQGLYISRTKGSNDNIVKWTPRLKAAWEVALAVRAQTLARPTNQRRPIPIRPEQRFIFLTESGTPLTRAGLDVATTSQQRPRPAIQFHRWQANLRILEISEIKTVPHVPLSHPFVERLIGTVRRELLDHIPFWGARDLERKLMRHWRALLRLAQPITTSSLRDRRAALGPIGPVGFHQFRYSLYRFS